MKSIPVALQTHLDQDTTTLCLLTRILTKSGQLFGFTDLDADVVYNPATVDPFGTGDSWGSATHSALNGFTPSRVQASADMAVDNAELSGLIMPGGITMQQIRAGLFDAATVRVYRVNYMNLAQGHELVQYGRAGATKFSNTGWSTEFRSLTQLLMQANAALYSLDCRARFGSKAIGTGDGSFEEAHPCGKSFTWTTGTITGVGSNARRIFTDTALTQTGDFFSPGVVEVLSGPNAGAQMEVDSYDGATKTITLALSLPYTLTNGTSYRVRQDCSKLWDDANHGCLYHFGSLRKDHFQGEPHVPVSDGGSNMVPGAQITRAR